MGLIIMGKSGMNSWYPIIGDVFDLKQIRGSNSEGLELEDDEKYDMTRSSTGLRSKSGEDDDENNLIGDGWNKSHVSEFIGIKSEAD